MSLGDRQRRGKACERLWGAKEQQQQERKKNRKTGCGPGLCSSRLELLKAYLGLHQH